MGNLIDLTNQIFGDYKVTGFDNSKGKKLEYNMTRKNHYLGIYSNLEDVIKIRKDAEKKYFGKFLRKEGDLNNGLG